MFKFLDRHNIPRPNWVDAVCLTVLGLLIGGFIKKKRA